MQTTNDMTMLIHMLTHHVEALGRIMTSNPLVVLNECGLVSDHAEATGIAMCHITEYVTAFSANASTEIGVSRPETSA